jgi:hypothetical protein
MKKLTPGILLFIAISFSIVLAASAEAKPVRHYYTGKIGQMPVQMDLTIDGSDVSGNYYYEKTGKPIELKGKLTADQAVVKEYPEEKKTTGAFTGKLDASRKLWSGTWESADGKRKFPFNVKAVADYVITEGKIEGVGADFAYPQFIGTSPEISALNKNIRLDMEAQKAELRKAAREMLDTPYFKENPERVKEWYYQYDTGIEYASPTLVSLLVFVDDFLGGAHGMHFYTSQNYSITNGKVKTLSLDDLFTPGYMPALSKVIIDDLKKQDAFWVSTGEITKLDRKDLDTFTITPTGIEFYFDPYAVGPYAQGAFFVTLPYKVMKSYIGASSPLRRFVR